MAVPQPGIFAQGTRSVWSHGTGEDVELDDSRDLTGFIDG
jgi:hypothetical protein